MFLIFYQEIVIENRGNEYKMIEKRRNYQIWFTYPLMPLQYRYFNFTSIRIYHFTDLIKKRQRSGDPQKNFFVVASHNNCLSIKMGTLGRMRK